MRRFIPLLLFWMTLFMPGCLAPDFDLDMNPFFRNLEHEGDATADTDALIPIGHARRTPEYESWGIRPLYNERTYTDRDRKEWDFIPPFGRAVVEPERTTCRFWPLYWYTRTQLTGKGEDVDWILFPLIYGGHSGEGENYFAFFPLGGRIRNFIGYESWDFVLWPLYQRIRKKMKDEDCVSHSILWFLSWTVGGKRDGSFQVLPFYMHRQWEGKYDKYSVLWPFFHYQENRMDTGNPSKLYGFWPLFTYEYSAVHSRLGLLGPLFFIGPLVQIARETPEKWDGRTNVEGHSYYLYDVPWPLVRIEKKRSHEYFRCWPFYSHYQEPGFDSRGYMVPFFWHRQEQTSTYDREDYDFVPFFHSMRKTYKEDTGEDRYLQVWPLFHHDALADGSLDFSTLSLLPSGTETYIEPMDEAFWPFWNIYRYRREPSGAARHDALLGLFSMYTAPDEFRLSLPLVYSYHETRALDWRHDLLLGLISFGGDDEGLKKLKLLFIPFLDT